MSHCTLCIHISRSLDMNAPSVEERRCAGHMCVNVCCSRRMLLPPPTSLQYAPIYSITLRRILHVLYGTLRVYRGELRGETRGTQRGGRREKPQLSVINWTVRNEYPVIQVLAIDRYSIEDSSSGAAFVHIPRPVTDCIARRKRCLRDNLSSKFSCTTREN